MTTRMLIDARHPEETRVAVLKGNRIDEFDFDSADHKQIKGDIYLAKVTRVEPSLQAAFVDFGGNRHGFLAFSEIHPDYYQIPKEDREALLAEEAEHAAEEAALRAAEDAEDEEDETNGDYHGDEGHDDDDADHDNGGHGDRGGGVTEIDTSEKDQVATIEGSQFNDSADDEGEDRTDRADADRGAREDGDEGESGDENRDDHQGEQGDRNRRGRRQGGRGQAQAKEADELRAKRMALRRRYKIQDVIQRRQVLLVQVVKEERGNKGAALTSYLSLAGRYCVLMPNSSHGGGISRKISSVADRKRLKSIIGEMHLPKSMGCIVRTAGLQRTKTEIKRDFDYLARLWDGIREVTLRSSAPALIHSDSDLIKRAIRDIYNSEVEEVIVEGEAGYRAARDFMKLLMPSHARRVKAYVDPVPLFQRFGAEDQLTAMYDPVVQLKSGGYIVINPTEALVSIDINSGRSTKEHGIEATAVSTNLEAAREIARQLRLRDMAGLVVIDFIDMEYNANIRKVEKAMKDALRDDRARIQVGRISGFGLMEMSRQRLRTGVLEATTRGCPHCDGTGLVRTAGSAGLSALRLIEEEAAKGKGSVISLFASQEAAVYVLNAKRGDLGEIEGRYGVRVEVIPEGENEGAKMRVGSSGPRPEFVPRLEPIMIAEEEDEDIPEEEVDEELEAERGARDEQRGDGETDEARRKRRKRRRGRGRDDADGTSESADESHGAAHDHDAEDGGADDEAAPPAGGANEAEGDEDHDGEEGPRKRRRRGRRRRGGRNRAGEEGGQEGGDDSHADGDADGEAAPAEGVAGIDEPKANESPATHTADQGAEAAAVPAKKRRARKAGPDADASAGADAGAGASVELAASQTKPRRRGRKADVAPTVESEGGAGAAGAPEAEAASEAEASSEATGAEAQPIAPKSRRARAPKAAAAASDGTQVTRQTDAPVDPTPAPAPAPARKPRPEPVADGGQDMPADAEGAEGGEGDDGSPRRGWWQRTFGA